MRSEKENLILVFPITRGIFSQNFIKKEEKNTSEVNESMCINSQACLFLATHPTLNADLISDLRTETFKISF